MSVRWELCTCSKKANFLCTISVGMNCRIGSDTLFYSSFDFYLYILFVQFYLIFKEKFACILLHFSFKLNLGSHMINVRMWNYFQIFIFKSKNCSGPKSANFFGSVEDWSHTAAVGLMMIAFGITSYPQRKWFVFNFIPSLSSSKKCLL